MKSILSVLGYEHKDKGILGPATAFLGLLTSTITNDEKLNQKRKQMIAKDSDTTLGSSSDLSATVDGVALEIVNPTLDTIQEKISETKLKESNETRECSSEINATSATGFEDESEGCITSAVSENSHVNSNTDDIYEISAIFPQETDTAVGISDSLFGDISQEIDQNQDQDDDLMTLDESQVVNTSDDNEHENIFDEPESENVYDTLIEKNDDLQMESVDELQIETLEQVTSEKDDCYSAKVNILKESKLYHQLDSLQDKLECDTEVIMEIVQEISPQSPITSFEGCFESNHSYCRLDSSSVIDSTLEELQLAENKELLLDLSERTANPKFEELDDDTPKTANAKLVRLEWDAEYEKCEIITFQYQPQSISTVTKDPTFENQGLTFPEQLFLAVVNRKQEKNISRSTAELALSSALKGKILLCNTLENQLLHSTKFNAKLQKKFNLLKWWLEKYKFQFRESQLNNLNLRLRLYQAQERIQSQACEQQNQNVEFSSLNEKYSNLTCINKEITETLSIREKRISDLEEERKELQNIISSLKTNIKNENEKVFKLELQLADNVSTVNALKSKFNQEKKEATQTKATLESQVDSLNAKCANLKASFESLNGLILEKEVLAQKMNSNLSTLKHKFDKKHTKIEELKNENAKLRKKIISISEELQEVANHKFLLTQKISGLFEHFELKIDSFKVKLEGQLNRNDFVYQQSLKEKKKEVCQLASKVEILKRTLNSEKKQNQERENIIRGQSQLITALNLNIIRKQKLLEGNRKMISTMQDKYRIDISSLEQLIEHQKQEFLKAISELNEKDVQCNIKIAELEEQYSKSQLQIEKFRIKNIDTELQLIETNKELTSAMGKLHEINEKRGKLEETIEIENVRLKRKVTQMEEELRQDVSFFFHLLELLDEEILDQVFVESVEPTENNLFTSARVLLMKTFTSLLKCKKERDVLKGNVNLYDSPNKQFEQVFEKCNYQSNVLNQLKNIHFGNSTNRDFLTEWRVGVNNLESIALNLNAMCASSERTTGYLHSRICSMDEKALKMFLKTLEIQLKITPVALSIKERIQNVFLELYCKNQKTEQLKNELECMQNAIQVRDDYVRQVLRGYSV
ncbi:hypothetical protein HDV06_001792 [Boothiomyces sp. JEL0866]|nr:hypothetical protein HDV06_001792 [Boothiomyces sp. JEL0866]